MADYESDRSQDMDEVRREIHRMIREFYVNGNPLSVFSAKEWLPPADVYETPQEVVIRMEIGGMKNRDIHVVLDGDRLMVSGKRLEPPKESAVTYRQMEIKYAPFCRTFTMPSSIDEENVKAEYSDGFLRVRIGKRAVAEGRPRKVQIQVKG